VAQGKFRFSQVLSERPVDKSLVVTISDFRRQEGSRVFKILPSPNENKVAWKMNNILIQCWY
jgi:hypothetical protein